MTNWNTLASTSAPTVFDPQPTTQQSPQEEEVSTSDYFLDIGRGIYDGVTGFGTSIGSLADSISETFGYDLADDSTWEVEKTSKTGVGSLVAGITQFAIGFVPGLGVAGALGKAAGIAKLAGVAKWGATAVQGAVAGGISDFISFKEHEERLSNLIQEYPVLQNPVTEYLAADPNDEWAEGRLKNVLEGLGLGMVMGLAVESLKGFKGIKLAGKDTHAARAASEEAVQKMAAELEALEAAHPGESTFQWEAKEVSTTKTTTRTTTTEAIPDMVPAPKPEPKYEPKPVDESTSVAIKTQVLSQLNSGVPLEDAVYQSMKTHLNIKHFLSDQATLDTMGIMAKILDDKTVREVGYVSDKRLKQNVKRLALDIGGDETTIMSMMAKDGASLQHQNVRVVLYRFYYQYNTDLFNTALKLAAENPRMNGVRDRLMAHNIEVFSHLRQISAGSSRTLHAHGVDINDQLGKLAGRGDNPKGLEGIIPAQKTTTTKVTTRTEKSTTAIFEKILKEVGTADMNKFYAAALANDGDVRGMTALFDSLAGKMKSSKIRDVHMEVWLNAILSGSKTNLTNIMSGMSQTFLLPAERMIGGVWNGDMEMLKSGFNVMVNTVSEAFNVFKLTSDGLKIRTESPVVQALKSFKNESPGLDALSSVELKHAFTHEGSGKLADAVNFLGKVVRLPSRFLTSTDEFFKQLNYRAVLTDEATRDGIAKGFKDKDLLAQHVSQYMAADLAKVSEGEVTRSLRYARESTFTSDLQKGTFGKSLQDLAASHPNIRLILPFIRTPTNIFRRFTQYTPGLNMFYQEYRDLLTSANAVDRATAKGRMALGGMFWTGAITLSQTGKFTGGGPANPKEKEILEATGWRPYSIVFTDDEGKKSYLSYAKMEPLNMILGIAADYAEFGGDMNEVEQQGVVAGMLGALANNITNKSYLTGLSQVMDAIMDPDNKMDRWVQNRAASYFPSISQTLANDPVLRQIRGTMDAMRARLPGWSASLPPRRNVFGEPLAKPYSVWNPLAVSQRDNDPVMEQLSKLYYGFSGPSMNYHKVDLTTVLNEEGQDAFDYYQAATGTVTINGKTMREAMKELFESSPYNALPEVDHRQDKDHPRVRAVQSIIASYRVAAEREMLRAYPQVRRRIEENRASQRLSSTTPILQRLSKS